jgi:glutathione S-transferase
MMVIWGRHTSSNVQKLLWACTEMGVPYERRDMAGKFGFTDEYLAMNPNAVVPTIDEDGFILWESNACLRYLAAKYDAGGLWPEDLRIRADADRWMDWQSTTFWPSLRPAFQNLVRVAPDKRDHDAIRKAGVDSTRVLKMLDDHLADRPYIAGDRFTMGDIPMGVLGRRWFDLDIERPEARPHVEAWFNRLKQRPAYRQHILIPME